MLKAPRYETGSSGPALGATGNLGPVALSLSLSARRSRQGQATSEILPRKLQATFQALAGHKIQTNTKPPIEFNKVTSLFVPTLIFFFTPFLSHFLLPDPRSVLAQSLLLWPLAWNRTPSRA